MKLDEVSKVKVTFEEDAVNQCLKDGYKILKILSSKRTTGGGSETVMPCFILGKDNG